MLSSKKKGKNWGTGIQTQVTRWRLALLASALALVLLNIVLWHFSYSELFWKSRVARIRANESDGRYGGRCKICHS